MIIIAIITIGNDHPISIHSNVNDNNSNNNDNDDDNNNDNNDNYNNSQRLPDVYS